MKIAYFVNQYPKVSHTFIRREILALERLGLQIERYALRGWDAEVVDEADRSERERTHFLLRDGLSGLLGATARAALSAPLRFVRGLALAWRQWRGGDRSLALNLVTLAEACLLVEWMRRDRIDHLHVHFGTNSALIAMMAKAIGGPDYSFTMHGSEEWDSPRQLRLREKIAEASFVAAVSSHTRAQLMRWCRESDQARLHVVHCGLERDAMPQAAPLAEGNRRLVCVGRLCPEKAQTLLIEAVARLSAQGVDIELVLAGDGETRPQVEALIRRHRLEQRIRITGWIDSAQVQRELAAARALILPSLVEGLPVVIMEAMAARRPVLCTYVGGIAELVRPGEHGWMFPAGSVDAMVVAMRECLEAPVDRLRAMGDAACERVWQRHSVDHEATKLAALFRQLGHEPSAAASPSAPMRTVSG